MFSRLPAVTRYLSVAALCVAGPVHALEFPLPPPGEDVVGQVQVIKGKYEDSFSDLGNQYELGYSEMIAANPGVDAWLPVKKNLDGSIVDTDIVLPTQFILPPGKREGIVINLAEYRLYYFPKDQNKVYTFPLGIGREGWGSPLGLTKVTAKTPNPTWTPPASIKAEHAANGDPLPNVVPAGPDNPLGPFKFTLGMPGYLIHGSNAKFGIGTGTSHGCFRMLNKNVLELAKMVPVGTPVRIINEPYKLGVSGGKVFLEVHEPLNVKDGSLLAKSDKSHLTQEDLQNKYAGFINFLLKHKDLEKVIQIDKDKAFPVVGAETGIPQEIGVANTTVQQGESLDYVQ
ncbi:L,D-transpeptidase family protein [Pseudomonas sp. FSL R10-0399]|uniref:L,D-transpeptidase family protein n=1 Tax=Pseudomonas sp. FSL R10-0399 TaxID=2662194 RepID=UPI001294D5DF|nr:L,D-transpeptidase family protein [Pseudomonas sp. FSL R10-0399]MQT58219.1 L,D-transpeptidase family protein [Pseudomonas sp. FSL R10-0399]